MGETFLTRANRQILDEMLYCVTKNKLSHAYIFEGSSNIGKKTIALELSRAITCEKNRLLKIGNDACGSCDDCLLSKSHSHPDIISVTSSGKKSIGADDIRAVIADAYVKPFRSAKKIYIIEDATLLTPAAQNAMLKILEEPPQYVIFLILTSNIGLLLPTIISRATIIKFNPASNNEIIDFANKYLPEFEPEFVATISSGIIGDAINLKDNPQLFATRKEDTQKLLLILSKEEHWIFDLCDYLDNNKNRLDFILNLWYSVIYDALLLRLLTTSEKDKHLVNSDLKQESIYLAQEITAEKLISILDSILLSQKMLARYINARAIGYNLLLHIFKLQTKENV